MYRRFLLLLFFLLPGIVFTQENNSTSMIVDSIVINGNRKTKDRIILRELDFAVGDTINLLTFEERMTLAKKRLYNTSLFTLININFRILNSSEGKMNVVIDLIENLFIYPAPIFDFADGFNVWWNLRDRSLKRVNYGASVKHINLTGAKDKLKVKFQRGFTRKYEINYQYPYINDNLGIGAHIFYAEQKEIGYKTIENITEFFRDTDERIMLRRFRTGLDFSYRNNLFIWQNLKLEFHRNGIDDQVANQLNPDYFLNGMSRMRFFLLEYNFDYNKRIFNFYPEGGFRINVNIKKEGLGIFNDYNNLPVFIDADKHFKISDRLITSFRVKAKTNIIRNKVAFANNTGLGYGEDIVGGYELYVIDGSDFVLGENQVKFKVFDNLINLGKFMKFKSFKKLDLKVFLRGNVDFAYVNERHYTATNTLNNKWIIGFGPALDFIFFHNFSIKFEYSRNQFGEFGLFIHNSKGF